MNMKYFEVRKTFKQRKTMMYGLKITITPLGRSLNNTENQITVLGDTLEKQFKTQMKRIK